MVAAKETTVMALHISPEIQARIIEKIEAGEYPDADAVLDEALTLIEERARYRDLKRAIARGVDEVAQGKVIEFTPERREQLWQQAIAETSSGQTQRRHGGN